MSARRRWTWVAGAALLSAVATAGCGGPGASSEEQAAPVPTVAVRIERVALRMFQPAVFAPGQWIAASELVVAAPFPAVVDSIAPHPGDRVASHEIIGWLTTRESEAAVRGAELLLQQAADSTARTEARRALALARRDIVRVPLLAATAGTVQRRSVEPGAVVADGAEMLSLMPDRALVFEAHIPLAEAGRVRVGQRARVANEGGEAVEGFVQRFLPRASAADQTALVWLAPEGKPPAGLLGRFGTAAIETGPSRRAPAVPDSALAEDDLTGEVRLARVDSAGVALWTSVKLGIDQNGWRELVAPALPLGTPVVISGQRGLPDSSRVDPVR